VFSGQRLVVCCLARGHGEAHRRYRYKGAAHQITWKRETDMTKKTKQDDDTEWLPQQEITLRTGMSASWVHAQGAKGTVRRSKSGTWKGRPVYVYAYADVVREADSGKLQAHRREMAGQTAAAAPPSLPPTIAGVPTDLFGVAMPSAPPPAPSTEPVRAAIAALGHEKLDKFAAWLRDGWSSGYITQEQARAMLVAKAKL
jgi:hypothetical protein